MARQAAKDVAETPAQQAERLTTPATAPGRRKAAPSEPAPIGPLAKGRAREYFKIGNAHHEGWRLPQAIKAFREAIKANPKFADAYNSLGVALYQSGELTEAIGTYRMAVTLDSRNPSARHNLALALRDNGQFQEAIAEHHRAIRLRPDSGWYVAFLGTTLAASGQIPEAITAFAKALELASENEREWVSRAAVDALSALKQSKVGESIEGDYTDDTPSSEAAVAPPLPMGEAEIIQAAAELLSTVYPAEHVDKALEDLAAKASRETTARAKAKPRPEIEAKLAEVEAKAVEIGDATLFGLVRRFQQERAAPLLPDGVALNAEQAKAAARLPATFNNLQARLKLHGLEPLPPDEPVKKARRQSVGFYRHRKAQAATM